MKFFLTLFGILLTVSVFSQTDTITVNDLKKMSLKELLQVKVVSASKFSQKATDAPATIYVVTKQQIEERGYSCLIELLDDVPQVEITRKSDAQTTNTITMSGVEGSSHFILLMDGIRINSTTGTQHTIFESYSLANTKQVEIILGPASSLYGADAFTGIINIITNKGYENKGIHLSSSYGMYNTTDNTIVYGVGNKNISFALTGKYYHSDEPFMPDYYSDEYAWYQHYQQTGEMMAWGDTIRAPVGIKPWATPTDAYTIHGRLNFQKIEIGYLQQFESHSSSFASNPETSVYAEEAIYGNRIQNIYLSHNYLSTNEKLNLKFLITAQEFKTLPKSLFYNVYTDYNNAYKYERNRTLKFEEQVNYNFSKKIIMVGGISYMYASAIPKTSDLPVQYDENKPYNEQNIYYPGTNITDFNGNDLTIIQDIYNVKYHNLGSYLQFHAHLLTGIFATAGVRYDYNSAYGSTVNPRLGLVYRPINKLTLKLLYGQAYLAPSPYDTHEQYGSFYATTNENGDITGLASSFWRLAKDDLEPKKRVSYDFNSSYQANSQFAISINGYYGQISNLYSLAYIEKQSFHGVPVETASSVINAGSLITYGGTLRLDYRNNFDVFGLNCFAAYSYSDGEINDGPLIVTAKNTIKAGLNFSYKSRVNIYTKFQYRNNANLYGSTIDNPLILDPFYYIDLTGNYKIVNTRKLKLKVFVKITNLLNNRYYMVGGDTFSQVPQDPFRMNLGVKIEL